MAELPEALPHGAIESIFPDVFFVTGMTRPTYSGRTWQFSRNMTILRDGDDLTLVNTVRLDENGLRELERLGRVANIVRLGCFHGRDDAFYVRRYDARLWAWPDMQHDHELRTDVELGGEGPVAGCTTHRWATSSMPEGLLLIAREGGILVACDSLQNWVETDPWFDDDSAAMMREYGFIRPANIGPGWRQACSPSASDFHAVLALPFRHLLSAHGVPLRDRAHAMLTETFAREYP